MAKASAKKDDAVTETVESEAPTKSLFAGGKPVPQTEPEAEATETAEVAQEASEATVEATEDGPSIEELRRVAEEAQAKLNERMNAEKSGIIAQVVQVCGEYGITTEEVVNALGGYKPKRSGQPAKPKYRDEATGAEWSGRGKPPLWIKDKNREDYLIEKPAA